MRDLVLEKKFKNKTITGKQFEVIIEITKGSKNKYEYDHSTGFLHLDRILYTSTHYPQNYGFIPSTLASDGDPLDVLVICTENIIPLSTVTCKPIGVLKMLDSGKSDYKIVAVPLNDPYFNCYDDINELPLHLAEEIKHFFKVYKSLEGKRTNIGLIHDKNEAIKVIEECIEAYNKQME